jgi:hypothetical protein
MSYCGNFLPSSDDVALATRQNNAEAYMSLTDFICCLKEMVYESETEGRCLHLLQTLKVIGTY